MIGKGVWRVVGTIAGMVVAFVLMGCFAQQPLLFILGFAFWLGVCVAGMTLLRHFRASGTVVAGYDRPRDLRRDAASRADLRARDRARLDGRDRRAVPEPRVDAARHARCPRKTRSAGDAHHGRRRAGHRRAAQRRRRPPTTSGTRCSPASTASTICSRSARPNRKISRSAAAVRHGMASLFGALVGGTPPLPADSPGAQAVASLQPRLAAAWQAAADALGEGPAVRRTRLRGWPMRAKACVWRSTVSRSAIRATKRRY